MVSFCEHLAQSYPTPPAVACYKPLRATVPYGLCFHSAPPQRRKAQRCRDGAPLGVAVCAGLALRAILASREAGIDEVVSAGPPGCADAGMGMGAGEFVTSAALVGTCTYIATPLGMFSSSNVTPSLSLFSDFPLQMKTILPASAIPDATLTAIFTSRT